ncbi:hypothetical protein SADUNF_Sadunf13G0116500 [Salix dunnii]|uniref:non-specific serine/threonine protein kinase n=1 Tax=Salix dunnii TaxID=1413687 RepID=A0A835JLS4_9ROSI|nr:hypothetical protein SADUNF_Sadunf13G0116500 [Salix dunnii]
MLPPTFFLYVFLFCSLLLHCLAGDTLTTNSPLRDSRGETLVSNGEEFELGFFTPNGSTGRRYVGIWYYKSSPRTVVWVANRDNPLLDHNGVFSVVENGNLEILDGRGGSLWSTNLEKPSSMNRIAKLMDTGNLVVSDEDDDKHLTGLLWQSFENPSETFLPGMKLDENMVLISWKSYDDPASGNFSFQQDREANQFVIWKRSIRYWRSGVSDNGGSSRSEMPSAISYFLSNFTSTSVRNDSVPYITSSLYTNTRMVMSFAGQIQYLQLNTEKTWSVIWAQPRTRCSLYNACGNFGSCNSNNEVVCKCLPGFQPVSPEYWNSGDNSRGCTRRSPLCSNSAASDTFLSLNMMRVANPDAQFKVNSEVECKMECLNNCQCEAFSYEKAETTKGGESESATCWIWTDDLRDIQEEYDGGRDLNVRVSVSDIESSAATCETCGTNMIPYPLSTGPKCGDPAYLNFYCNLSSGQLNFKARGDTYRVTKINPGMHTFVIQTETADSCQSIKSNGNLLQLNQSSPFHVIRFCHAVMGNISSTVSLTGGDEVEIGWDPPSEPTCFSSSDCKDWPNSSCSVRRDGKKLCLCNAPFKWDGLKLKCTGGHYNERKNGSSIGNIPLSLIIAVALISLIALAVLSSTIVCICLQRRRMPKLRENKGSFPRNLGLHFNGSERLVKDLIDPDRFSEEETKAIDVPCFDLESLVAATDNFSNANKLGQGGFGPVYKAWNLWKEDKAMELLDQTLSKTCNTNEFLKCVNVGLLCVQEDPSDRPTVSNILFMLGSEAPTLPDPKQPAFVIRRCPSSRASSSSKPDTVSNNGLTLSELRPFAYYLTLNLKGDDIYVTYSASENSAILRVTLVPDGRIELLLWQEINNDWLSTWQWPSTYCEFYAQCSPFSSCDPKGSQDHCKCLPGFQPKVQQEWDMRNRTGGTCVRQKALRCNQDDGFLKLVNMKLPDHSYILGNMSTNDCESRCLRNCSCTAYAYLNTSEGTSGKCLNWNGDLMDLVQDYVGSDLYIRLHDRNLVENVKKSAKFTRKKKHTIIIAVAAISIGLLGVLCGYFIWRKSFGKQERIEKTCTGMSTSFEIGKSETELNIFSFNQIVAVTNDFCEENKLGEGGFGPVYKAWELWNDDRGQELIDPSIRDTSECPERALKCIHVGLLCVQESPVDRPTMPLVVQMLSNDNASLPSPEEPAFSSINRRKSCNAVTFSPDHNTPSSYTNNELTITLKRFRIIKCIAQGRPCIRKYSRSRVIHWDLKASNASSLP